MGRKKQYEERVTVTFSAEKKVYDEFKVKAKNPGKVLQELMVTYNIGQKDGS